MFESRLTIQRDLIPAGGTGQQVSYETKQGQIQPLATGKAGVWLVGEQLYWKGPVGPGGQQDECEPAVYPDEEHPELY